MSEKMNCSYCKTEFDEGDQFCNYCGAQINQIDNSGLKVKDSIEICPACGKKIDKEDMFCQYCGEAICNQIPNTKKEKNNKYQILLILGYFYILIGMLGLLLLFSNEPAIIDTEVLKYLLMWWTSPMSWITGFLIAAYLRRNEKSQAKFHGTIISILTIILVLLFLAYLIYFS